MNRTRSTPNLLRTEAVHAPDHGVIHPRWNDLARILDFRRDESSRKRSSDASKDEETAIHRPEAYKPLFDLLHTDRGLQSFKTWLRTQLSDNDRPDSVREPAYFLALSSNDGSLVTEYQFLALLRVFCECAASDVFDFFDILDFRREGYLDFRQIYLAVCVVTAKACSFGRKLIYLHGDALHKTLLSVPDAGEGLVPWSKIISWFHIFEVPPRVVGEIVSVLRSVREENEDLKTKGFWLHSLPVDTAASVLYQVMRNSDHGWSPNTNAISASSVAPRQKILEADNSSTVKLCTTQ